MMEEPVNFDRIIEDARAPDVTDSWIATLARQLAESGDIIREHSGHTADIPSTGGPSSLSTLLCPLFLSMAGRLVPKLGVPGRPAGGLDVMSQIPGYRTQLTPSEVKSVLGECRYAHFDAAGRFAPMDGKLFAYRQSTGAQNVIPLVIASLLSKKIAVGVERVGLDIRVAEHGNFGPTSALARVAANRFISVATLLGVKATAFITDGYRPYQPYIGRGEALLALHAYFMGSADRWLARHIDQCAFMAHKLGAESVPPEPPIVRRQFDMHLAAQGADPLQFDEVVNRLKEQKTFQLRAREGGYVSFDLFVIRELLVAVQRDARAKSAFPDPAGVVLLVEPDSFVVRDQPLIRVRSESEELRPLIERLEASVSISRFTQQNRVDVIDA